MRVLHEQLQAKLDSGATTLCRCWRVDRRDGVSLGFTDHDEKLVFGGVKYEASSGLTASAVEAGAGLGVDNAEATGVLNSEQITEADINAGLYDDADVRLWLVDWGKPFHRVLIFRGSLGEITRGKSRFRAELRGLSERLNRPVGRSFVTSCACNLGDQKCLVDTNAPTYRADRTVAATDGRTQLEIDDLGDFAPGWFDRGLVEWTSGPSAGSSAVVQRHSVQGQRTVLDLWTAPPAGIAVGDNLVLRAGCDKRFDTCRSKFSNGLNFHGFPHMPGDDWITTYPNRGEGHDGASRYS